MSKSQKYNESPISSDIRRDIRIIDIIFIVILIIISLFCILNYNFIKTEINVEIKLYGQIGLFVTAFILEITPQFLSPFFAIPVAIGSGINSYLAILIVILGSTLGSVIGFELGRKSGFRILCYFFELKKLRNMIIFWNKKGKIFVLISAITPVPYIPLLFGTLRMDRKEFWLWGIIPRAICFFIIGLVFHYGFLA